MDAGAEWRVFGRWDGSGTDMILPEYSKRYKRWPDRSGDASMRAEAEPAEEVGLPVGPESATRLPEEVPTSTSPALLRSGVLSTGEPTSAAHWMRMPTDKPSASVSFPEHASTIATIASGVTRHAISTLPEETLKDVANICVTLL